MWSNLLKTFNTLLLFMIAVFLGGIMMRLMQQPTTVQTVPMSDSNSIQAAASPTPAASLTPLPRTPLATLTPSQTLRPPPTFEPPTPTLQATQTPTITPTATIFIESSLPEELRRAASVTPTGEVACTPRRDWGLTYTVQFGDALATIAERYGTNIDELVAGNCLTDRNLIVEGQVLRVPGQSQPVQPAFDCSVGYEILTPFDGTMAVPGTGTLTFTWRGPETPRTLLRIERPDDASFRYEVVIELRQNEQINLDNLPFGGTYVWYIIPLDMNFQQVCPQGGPWRFTKSGAPTSTPTATDAPRAPSPSFLYTPQTGPAPLVVQFYDQSRGDITAWYWDFGDGGTSTERSPSHTFANPGTYLVTLTVTGPAGSDFQSVLVQVQ